MNSQEQLDKIVKRINISSRTQRLNAIQKFYEIYYKKKFEDFSEREKLEMMALSDERVRSYCIELATESVNLDLVAYKLSSIEENGADVIYQALLK